MKTFKWFSAHTNVNGLRKHRRICIELYSSKCKPEWDCFLKFTLAGIISVKASSQYYLLLLTPLRPIKTSCRSGNDVAWGDEVCDCDDDVIVGTSVDDFRPEVAVAITFSAFFENCRKKATARDLKKGLIICTISTKMNGFWVELSSF